MKAVSIDIETTGLNPETCQILEIGAVIFDTRDFDTPIEKLPTLRMILVHEFIMGEPAALKMNAGLIESIAFFKPPKKSGGETGVFIYPGLVTGKMWEFFARYMDANSVFVAGKNFNGFDRRFLDKLPKANQNLRFHRRTFDPAAYYFDPLTDSEIPSLSQCLERAGMNPTVNHSAVDDARQVVALLRHAWKTR